MGVDLGSVDNFNGAANALGTVMFEEFDPTRKGIEIIRDYLADRISIGQTNQRKSV